MTVFEKPDYPSDFNALAYHHWVGAASAEDLNLERTRLEKNYPELTPKPMVQLAILLSASKLATPESERRALTLLESFTDPADNTQPGYDYVLFAKLWRNHLQQKQTSRQLRSENQHSQEELSKLQEQLDVLMTIEKQLMEREQSLELSE